MPFFFFFKIMLKFMLLRVAEYFEISASLLYRVQKTIFPSWYFYVGIQFFPSQVSCHSLLIYFFTVLAPSQPIFSYSSLLLSLFWLSQMEEYFGNIQVQFKLLNPRYLRCFSIKVNSHNSCLSHSNIFMNSKSHSCLWGEKHLEAWRSCALYLVFSQIKELIVAFKRCYWWGNTVAVFLDACLSHLHSLSLI